MHRRALWAISFALLLIGSLMAPAVAHDGEHHDGSKEETGWPGSAKGQELARAFLADSQPAADVDAQTGGTPCDPLTGLAGEYPCKDVDLASFLPLADIGGGKGNDIWGWTDHGDPRGPREYALQGRTTGTSFVDITDPYNPIYVGNLPTTRFSSTWRDIKVYGNHAFVVSESSRHGMQVFDLTRLRNVTSPPVTFSADARYTGFNTAHNVAINEASGFAYAVGTDTCSGGLHIVNVQNPLKPIQAGCFSDDGYTHDVQCVNYAGPDPAFQPTADGPREICFAANEDTVTIVDVTNKAAPTVLSRVTYPGVQYTHQGWLTEDHRYFLVDDELDEDRNAHPTHTYVFDVATLTAPWRVSTFEGATSAIDHNQYIVGDYSFQSNYRGGLRVIDISNKTALAEVAYFDTYPADTLTEFNGSWSNYPFFASGFVAVSDIERGLFIVKPNLAGGPTVAITSPDGTSPVAGDVTISATASTEVTQVDFLVDGVAIGVDTDGTNGWSITWDSTAVNNGERTLTATAIAGSRSASDSVVVTVDNPNLAPTARFTFECSSLSCTFDGSASTDGTDGTISTYEWDFGDGATGSDVMVSHTYAAGGTYTVTLTVTDNDGANDTDAQLVTVEGPSATVHVGDLDGSYQLKGKSGRWEAFATVTVHDPNEIPLAGVTVTGMFGNSSVAVSGTTGSDGTVTFGSGTLEGGISSVSFTVQTLDGAAPTGNHDEDGDSDGTTITVTKT